MAKCKKKAEVTHKWRLTLNDKEIQVVKMLTGNVELGTPLGDAAIDVWRAINDVREPIEGEEYFEDCMEIQDGIFKEIRK